MSNLIIHYLPLVDTVNALAKDLCDSNHPSTEEIIARRDQLNDNWEKLQQLLNVKRDELQAATGLCNFHIDVNETMVSSRSCLLCVSPQSR